MDVSQTDHSEEEILDTAIHTVTPCEPMDVSKSGRPSRKSKMNVLLKIQESMFSYAAFIAGATSDPDYSPEFIKEFQKLQQNQSEEEPNTYSEASSSSI
jgi:hypothetical protein